MEKYIVDRIEGNIVVLESENGEFLQLEKEKIANCKESDVIIKQDGIFKIDNNSTLLRKQQILKKQNSLFK